MFKNKILLFGCGNLGSLLLDVWNSNGYKVDVIESNKNRLQALKKKYNNINFYHFLDHVEVEKFNYIVLCIKPKDISMILKKVRISDKQFLISLMAGIKIKSLMSIVKESNIFRVMPNLFAQVMNSSTAIYCNSSVKKKERGKIEDLFKLMGVCAWLEKEEEMDFFTAIFGGGPAYLFYITNVLIDISSELGIKKEIALNLVFSLINGVSQYLKKNKRKDLSLLINKVASKGGTTEEALKYFAEDNTLKKVFVNAINRASQKSKELGKVS